MPQGSYPASKGNWHLIRNQTIHSWADRRRSPAYRIHEQKEEAGDRMPRRPISEWPLAERPREKLLGDGSHALSDAELLAIILRLGTKGASAIDLARHAAQQDAAPDGNFSAPQSRR